MADELPDFRDRDAVEAWLTGQKGSLVRRLAVRAAMRTLPYFQVEDRAHTGTLWECLFGTASAWHFLILNHFAEPSEAFDNVIAAGAGLPSRRDDRVESAGFAARCMIDADWRMIVRDAARAIDHAGHAAAAFGALKSYTRRTEAARDEEAAASADARC